MVLARLLRRDAYEGRRKLNLLELHLLELHGPGQESRTAREASALMLNLSALSLTGAEGWVFADDEGLVLTGAGGCGSGFMVC